MQVNKSRFGHVTVIQRFYLCIFLTNCFLNAQQTKTFDGCNRLTQKLHLTYCMLISAPSVPEIRCVQLRLIYPIPTTSRKQRKPISANRVSEFSAKRQNASPTKSKFVFYIYVADAIPFVRGTSSMRLTTTNQVVG